MGAGPTRLSFGEIIITTGICYDKLKGSNNNIDPVAIYTDRIPKFDSEKNKGINFIKFSYNGGIVANSNNATNLNIYKGGYTDIEKTLTGDKSSLIIWIGPFTRVRFYENANYKGLESIYENLTNNKIKIISCNNFNNQDKVIKNFKSFYVSMIGDLDREVEAFHDQKKSKSKCMSIEKFLLIIILFIILYLLWTKKIT